MDHKRLIQESLDYIEATLKTDISAQDLADRAGYSLYHYYRLFQAVTGMSVKQYMARRRLLHAVYAVRCGSSRIQAAQDYGFETYAGFYKAFRREFGCTPSAFLRASRAKQPCRVNLMEEHMYMTHKKAAQILKAWNLEREMIEDIYYDGTGSRNENAFYVGKSYVLKFTVNLGSVKNHIALSKAIEQQGLLSATVIPTADGREYVSDREMFCFLTKRLSGSQLSAQELYSNLDKARSIGETIGKLHLVLEQTDAAVEDSRLLETVRDWAIPKAKEIFSLPSVFWDTCLEEFERLYPELPQQIIHRDPNPGNLICTDQGISFVDFELSQRNVRIYDPCYAATAVLSESLGEKDPEQWLEVYRAILSGYDSTVGLTGQERRAAGYVVLMNQLICTVWFSQQEKYKELYHTNRDMTAWLAKHLEELKLG